MGGGEGRAGEGLSERSSHFLEKIMERLARHNRDADELAEAMQSRRKR